MVAPRASINQVVQIGPEVTPGTPVAATKLLTAFTWALGLKPTTKQFRGMGRQYPSASAELTTMSAGKVTGPGDYAQMAYLLSSLWGPATITAHGTSTAAKDWKWAPPLTGSYATNAKTYTVQVGDNVDAEQYAYLAFTGFSYSITRKAEVTIDADLISQAFTDGITMTASPTAVQQAPATGGQMNVYLDSSSAGIGATQLVDTMKLDYKASGYYDGYWPVSRANNSYASLIDKEKAHEVTLSLQANPTALALKTNYLDTGALCYVRVNGQGAVIEVDQNVGVGAATAGTFTLTYKGQTTAGIAYNATAAAVQSALTALSTIGANGVVVSGAAPSWTVKMAGALASDVTVMTGSGAGLTGGAFSITTTATNAALTHDMACFITDMKEFGNEEDVYAVQYTLKVAEDAAWSTGQAQLMTLTNLLSTL